MTTATEHRAVTERFADLFREMERSDVYHIEGAKVEIAEQIYLAMKRQGVSNAELARRLGKSRAYITKVLQGSTNFTIESLTTIAHVLDCQLDLRLSPRHAASELDELWEAGRRSASHSRALFRTSNDYIKLVRSPLRAAKESRDAPIPVAA